MSRIIICGGPRTGKTTLAEAMHARELTSHPPGPSIRHTDDLIATHDWSAASQHTADEWLNEPGPWIIEGVAMARALRKWREAHPYGEAPVDRVIRLVTPLVAVTKGQETMAKGEERVWSEIEGWLGRVVVRL